MFWTFQKYLQVSPSICWTPSALPSLARNGGFSAHWTLKQMMQKAVVFSMFFFSPYGCFRKWWYAQIIHFGVPLVFGNTHMFRICELMLNVFFWFFMAVKRSWCGSAGFTPVAPKISAIPAIEVLGKPVSCRRITWKKGDLNLQSLPQQKSRRCFYVGYFCRRILGVFSWFLGRKSERDMEVPWSWSSWFGLAIGGDWTRFGNLWLLECLAFWSCYLVPSTWFTCLVEVLRLLL